MVNKYPSKYLALLFLMVFLLPSTSTAKEPPLFFKNAKSIRYVIKSTVLQTTSPEPGICRDTTFDEYRMAFFIKYSVASTGTNYSRALIQGDCSAEGFVIVNERKAYRLTIDNSTGWGAIESGPRTTYLYCEKCEGLLEKNFDLTQ